MTDEELESLVKEAIDRWCISAWGFYSELPDEYRERKIVSDSASKMAEIMDSYFNRHRFQTDGEDREDAKECYNVMVNTWWEYKQKQLTLQEKL